MKRFFEVPVKAAKRGVDVRLAFAQLPHAPDIHIAIPSRRVTSADQLVEAVRETQMGQRPHVTSVSWSILTLDKDLKIYGPRALQFLARQTGRKLGSVDKETGRSLEGDIRLGAQLIGSSPLNTKAQLDAVRNLGFHLRDGEADWDQEDPAGFFDRTLTAGLSFIEGFTNEAPSSNLLEFMLPWARTPHVVSYVCKHFRVAARLNPHQLFQHASLRSDVWSYENKGGNEWNDDDDMAALMEGFNSGLVEFYREFECVPKRLRQPKGGKA